MSLTVAEWPFLSEEQRTSAQNERWWAECYVPSPADVTLRGVAHVIAFGGPGSGKSAAIKALERTETPRLLIVRYPIDRWPGGEHAWSSDYNHLGQMMACISMVIKKFLTAHPHQLDQPQLSITNRVYLRWLIEKYGGPRAFERWADELNQQALLKLLEHPFKDLYPTDTELLDVQGQIEELVTLSRRVGFEDGVAVLVDVNEADLDEPILAKMADLFGWLTPLQFEGFAIKAAIPEHAIDQAKLIDKSRGRITFTSLRWPAEDCRELSNRYVQAATDNRRRALTDIAAPELLTALEHKIQPIYGGPTPRAWVGLTATLLNQYAHNGQKLTGQNYNDLVHAYFANHVHLKLDRTCRGVWLGAQFISLDEQPFAFLEVLWQYRQSGDANPALLKIAGTQGNLNTIASRLRKKIEPVPDKPVYVQNTRSQGYWLENAADT
ncbi:MAG: winged helix-turn-helix domain-containing protein [Anaerolineae bacterium]|nr:winged helix-turn-helix domain-containing protein [Anaerolineae bacterium]